MNPIEKRHIDAITELVLGYTNSNLHIPSGMELRISMTLFPTEVVRIIDETYKVHPETWNLEAKYAFLKCFPRFNRIANNLDYFNEKNTTVLDVFMRLKGDRPMRGISGKSKNLVWEWLNTLNITPGTQIPDETMTRTKCRISWKSKITGETGHGIWFPLDKKGFLEEHMSESLQSIPPKLEHYWLEFE